MTDTPKRPRLPASKRLACAAAGVRYLVRTQQSIWIMLAATALAVGLGLWLGLSRIEWILLTLTCGGVYVAEGLNTAVETVVDLVQPDENPLAGLAKDVAAGAVLLATITAIVVGLFLFAPPLYLKLFA